MFESKTAKSQRLSQPDLPDLEAVPTDIWREIYKYQTRPDILVFARTSKKNYEKVLSDLMKYYRNKCQKATHGWQPLECLTSDKCHQTCLRPENFGSFLQHLPVLCKAKP